MANSKLDRFIDEHRHKSAVEHKVAKRDSGLDLFSAKSVDSPGELRGRLVVKTWANCSMIWCYVVDAEGALWDFPLYKKEDADSPFAVIKVIPLGSEIKAVFRASLKSGKIYCKSVSKVR